MLDTNSLGGSDDADARRASRLSSLDSSRLGEPHRSLDGQDDAYRIREDMDATGSLSRDEVILNLSAAPDVSLGGGDGMGGGGGGEEVLA
jgi:hypothetical protein